MKRKNASFTRILRCQASVRKIKANGDWADRSFQWSDYFGNPKCRLIGSYILNLQVIDQSVEKGRFFYVINPCVAEESASTSQEDCSHQYVFTETIEVEKGWSEFKRDIEIEVQKVEAEVHSLLHRWYTNIQRSLRSQQQCDYQILDRQLANAHMRTVLYGLGAVTSGLLGAGVAAKSGSKSTGVFGATLVFAVLETFMRLASPGTLDPMWWDPSSRKCPHSLFLW